MNKINNIKINMPICGTNYICKNFSKLKRYMAFLNNMTEFSSTIDSGKQFHVSITRHEKKDLRQLITDRGLTSFKLWPRNEET